MKNIKKISDNSLSELGHLCGGIRQLIAKDYLHVSEHLRPQISKQIEKLIADIEKEQDRREEEATVEVFAMWKVREIAANCGVKTFPETRGRFSFVCTQEQFSWVLDGVREAGFKPREVMSWR